jgi:hypothetical protein
MSRFRFVPAVAAFALITFSTTTASAFFHLWRFTEFFSNADGTVQFIELQSSGPFETQANGAEIRSASAGKVLTLTQNLSGSTQNKRLLLATAGFESLPGAIAPDFPATPLPENFFNPAGDTVTLFHHQLIDSKTFTSVPTDGVTSRVYPSNTLAGNSPTNFLGHAGTIDLSIIPGDYNDDGVVDTADYVVWRENLNTTNTIPNDTTPGWVMDEDYVVWKAEFGRAAGTAAGLGSISSNTVPEPESLAILLLGVLILLVQGAWPKERMRPAVSGDA